MLSNAQTNVLVLNVTPNMNFWLKYKTKYRKHSMVELKQFEQIPIMLITH